MASCGIVGEQNSSPVYSGSVLWNGSSWSKVSFPTGSTLNDVMALVGTYVCSIVVPTTYSTDVVTIGADLAFVGKVTGDGLTPTLVAIDTALGTLDKAFTGYVPKSLFDANTIIYATADNTPLALTVNASTFVGRGAAGNIASLTAAQSRVILDCMEVDADSVYPISTTKPYSVGNSLATDKTIFVIKDSATFATSPYLAWEHAIFKVGDEVLSIKSKDATIQSLQVTSLKEDCSVVIASRGTGAATKDQEIVFLDQVGAVATKEYWALRRDGADSKNLKLIYYTLGTGELETLEIDTTNRRFKFNNTTELTGFLDEDTMVSNSAVHGCTQQSIVAYIASVAVSQVEMDATQVGAGLNTDGTYTFPAGAIYLTTATSLNNADLLLDAQVKLINDKITATPDGAGFLQLCAKVKYTYTDLAVTGSLGLIGSAGIPDNAIVTSFRTDVITAFTDDAGTNISTIGLGIETVVAGTEDLKNAAAIGTDFTIGTKADTWNDYDAATPFKLTAARDITVNVVLGGAATTLSTGVLYVYVTYFITQ